MRSVNWRMFTAVAAVWCGIAWAIRYWLQHSFWASFAMVIGLLVNR